MKPQMRVGLNALYLIPGGCGGLETFGRELIEALVSLDSGAEYVIFTSRAAKDVFTGLGQKARIVVCPFDAGSRMKRYFWEQFVLPWQAIAHGIDVLHSLAYVGPIISPVSTVLTVHDANWKAVGATMTRTRRISLSLISRLAAKTATVVATVSQFSRGELVQWYGLRPESISVVLSGPGSRPTKKQSFSKPDLEKTVSVGPFIAAIGGGYPHKNMDRLLEAYGKVAASSEHRLIIVGHLADQSLLGKMSDRVICTGYVSQGDLQEVLRSCDLFVMPSLYEGFGFPVLEAQALGAPVACSRTASLVELMNGSAALFDPENVDDMAAVMSRCLLDRKFNGELRSASGENVTRFSWAGAAQGYARIYEKLGSGDPIINAQSDRVTT